MSKLKISAIENSFSFIRIIQLLALSEVKPKNYQGSVYPISVVKILAMRDTHT